MFANPNPVTFDGAVTTVIEVNGKVPPLTWTGIVKATFCSTP